MAGLKRIVFYAVLCMSWRTRFHPSSLEDSMICVEKRKQFTQEQRNHYCPTHGIQHAWGANNLKIITLLRVIPTLTSHSDIVSDIASGIKHITNMYSDGLSGILSGITPDILCDILSDILSCIYISLFL